MKKYILIQEPVISQKEEDLKFVQENMKAQLIERIQRIPADELTTVVQRAHCKMVEINFEIK